VGNNPSNWVDPWGLCTSEDGDDDDILIFGWYHPGKTPPSNGPGPGKGWKWDPRGFWKKGGKRKHWHPPDSKHPEGHWDVEDRNGRKIGREFPRMAVEGALIIGGGVATYVIVKKIIGVILIIIPEPTTSAVGVGLVVTP